MEKGEQMVNEDYSKFEWEEMEQNAERAWYDDEEQEIAHDN